MIKKFNRIDTVVRSQADAYTRIIFLIYYWHIQYVDDFKKFIKLEPTSSWYPTDFWRASSLLYWISNKLMEPPDVRRVDVFVTLIHFKWYQHLSHPPLIVGYYVVRSTLVRLTGWRV